MNKTFNLAISDGTKSTVVVYGEHSRQSPLSPLLSIIKIKQYTVEKQISTHPIIVLVDFDTLIQDQMSKIGDPSSVMHARTHKSRLLFNYAPLLPLSSSIMSEARASSLPKLTFQTARATL